MTNGNGTHCTGGWVGPRAGLDKCRKYRPPPGFDPRTVQPRSAVAIPTALPGPRTIWTLYLSVRASKHCVLWHSLFFNEISTPCPCLLSGKPKETLMPPVESWNEFLFVIFKKCIVLCFVLRWHVKENTCTFMKVCFFLPAVFLFIYLISNRNTLHSIS